MAEASEIAGKLEGVVGMDGRIGGRDVRKVQRARRNRLLFSHADLSSI
jgi:hypothetical protein